MTKLTTVDISNITGAESTAIANINSNFQAVEDAMDNTLSRDGSSPNQMESDIDMNDNDILNVGTITGALIDFEDVRINGDSLVVPPSGADGVDGTDGWSPVYAIADDGARRVLKVVDWTGGTSNKPSINVYVGASGFTASIGSAVDIRGATGTSGAGTGDLLSTNNLSDISSTTTARSNLGLAIGTNVQAYDAGLQSISGLTTAADKMIYTTASDTYATATLTSFARTLLDDSDAATARATLGLTIGTNVQAYDAELAALASVTSAANKLPYFTGSGTASVADFTSFARTLLDDSDAATARATLGVQIGIDVQAYQAAQSQSTWEDGVGTTESVVSPAKIAAAILAQSSSSTIAPHAVLEDQKSAGTAAQSMTSSGWHTRNLNTEARDPSGYITISSNTFTPTQNGWVEWECPAINEPGGYGVDIPATKTRLYNSTDGSVVSYGTTGMLYLSHSFISTGGGAVTAGKAYRIDQYLSAASPYCRGGASIAGQGTQVYLRIKYWRT